MSELSSFTRKTRYVRTTGWLESTTTLQPLKLPDVLSHIISVTYHLTGNTSLLNAGGGGGGYPQSLWSSVNEATSNSWLTRCPARSANLRHDAHSSRLITFSTSWQRKLTGIRNDEESHNEPVKPHGLVPEQLLEKRSETLRVWHQAGDVASTSAQMMRLPSKYFVASLPSLHSSLPTLLSASACACVSRIPFPYSSSFFFFSSLSSIFLSNPKPHIWITETE